MTAKFVFTHGGNRSSLSPLAWSFQECFAELTCPCQVNEPPSLIFLWHNYVYHLLKSEFLSNRVTQNHNGCGL